MTANPLKSKYFRLELQVRREREKEEGSRQIKMLSTTKITFLANVRLFLTAQYYYPLRFTRQNDRHHEMNVSRRYYTGSYIEAS